MHLLDEGQWNWSEEQVVVSVEFGLLEDTVSISERGKTYLVPETEQKKRKIAHEIFKMAQSKPG